MKVFENLRQVRTLALGLTLTMVVSRSILTAADSDEKGTEIDLMTKAVKILAGARDSRMANIVKRAINACQIRQLGNLGKLTAADDAILKEAPTVSSEKEALTAAVAEYKRDGQDDAANALQALLDQRAKKVSAPGASGSKRANDIKRLEAKVDRIRKQLAEVESELARMKGR